MKFSNEYLSKIDYSKNRILIDWFSFSSRIDSFESFCDLLGMSDVHWECLPGVCGYMDRYYFNGISIHSGGGARFCGTSREQQVKGAWLEMSGSGCRTFETYGHGDWQALLDYVTLNSDQVTVNRLDLAYDDFMGLLDLPAIVSDTQSRNFISKFRSKPQIIESVGDSESAFTVTHGCMGSNIFIRIYDKRLEQEAQQFTDHWVRAEIMLRRENAAAAIDLLTDQYDYRDGVRFLISPKKELDEMYFLILNNYLRYIQPTGTDSNRWRAPVADHWKEFMESVTKFRISLCSTPGEDYSQLKLNNYVENVLPGVIYTYFTIHGVDNMIDICNSKLWKLSEKYKRLLQEAEAPLNGQVRWEEIFFRGVEHERTRQDSSV